MVIYAQSTVTAARAFFTPDVPRLEAEPNEEPSNNLKNSSCQKHSSTSCKARWTC